MIDEPRLLKVRIQAVYVVDVDGELREMASQPIEMGAGEWKALDSTDFAKSGAASLAAQLDPPPQT